MTAISNNNYVPASTVCNSDSSVPFVQQPSQTPANLFGIDRRFGKGATVIFGGAVLVSAAGVATLGLGPAAVAPAIVVLA